MNLDITEAVANKFDHTNWNTIKFSDLVENIVEKVVPRESGLEHYIGLEHLDSGSLHIRRFGKTESLKGDKLKIYKGDFIFAKRNSYLKRVAIADFDAVASAHSLVLRAKPENVLPEFLPFFLLSEIFWERAIEISVGSLSPTINWKVLAKQEFILPPKEQQAEIAELLWIQDSLLQKKISLLGKLNTLRRSMQKELYCKKDKVKLQNYASIFGGFAFSSNAFKNSGTAVIKIKNIVEGKILVDDVDNHINEGQFTNIDKFKLSTDDLLIAMTGATLGKLGVVPEEFSGAYLNQRVGKLQISEEVNRGFIYGICDSEFFLLELNKYIGEGAQGNISSDDLAKCLVPKISTEDTNTYGNKFDDISSTKDCLKKDISNLTSLQQSLIGQVF